MSDTPFIDSTSASRVDLPAAGSVTSGSATPGSAASSPEQLKSLAAQFEAMLMSQMMRDMQRSMFDDDKDTGFSQGPLTETLMSEMSLALSRSGGVGLAQSVSGALARQAAGDKSSAPFAIGGLDLPGLTMPTAPSMELGSTGHMLTAARQVLAMVAATPAAAAAATRSVVSSAVAPAALPSHLASVSASVAASRTASVTPSGAAPATVDVTDRATHSLTDAVTPQRAMAGRVSSAYGWRRDPIDGGLKFHKGTDIAMPTGQTVGAAASGQVAFAGEQAGYGLTVVIDHGGDLRTRYAHLSKLDVKVGQTVTRGQAIAQSGATGRATGPHLHFEVLDGGRPIDPAAFADRLVRGTALGD